jgi:hypothetical protein
MIDLFSESNMANVQSLPVEQQQRHRSTKKINGNNFSAHFGYVFFRNRYYENVSDRLK